MPARTRWESTTETPGGRLQMVAAAAGAVAIALLAWRESGNPGLLDALILALAVVPFIVCAVVGRVTPVPLVLVALPAALFALLDGAVLSAALPAIALVITVPLMPRRDGVVVAAVSAGLYVIVAIASREAQWLIVAVGLLAAWGGGAAFGEVREGMQELRVAGASVAEEAVREERRRLARELHDLVAHALTGTMLCLAEIRLSLDEDHEAVLAALDQADKLARESLADLRGTVRLLSEASDPALEPPIELETDLEELLEGYRRAGVEVEYTTSGTPLPLSITSAWCVFRVVQESLSNSARHARGAVVSVNIDWGRDGVNVRVRNALGTARSVNAPATDRSDAERRAGQGISGMSERVRLLGGRFAAGPTSTGWLVSGWIPSAPVGVVSAT